MTGRVDAHVHLWTRATDPQDWIDPSIMSAIDRDFDTEDLGDMLGATQCTAAIVVQSSNSLEETLRLVRLSGPVAGVVGWVDFDGDVTAQLERIRAGARAPIVGIRHLAHIDADPFWLARPEVSAGMGALAREGLSFDLVVRRAQLPLAAALAARHPTMPFVLDHLGDAPAPGDDLDDWSAAVHALAELPNVSAKLSGLISWLPSGGWAVGDLEPVVEVAFDAFGPRRLMYGSDWPLVELGGGAGAWREAAGQLVESFAAEDAERVFATNAAEAYGLG